MAPEQKTRKSIKKKRKKKPVPKRSRGSRLSRFLTPANAFMAIFIMMALSAFFIYLGHDDLMGLPPNVPKSSILVPQLGTFLVLASAFGYFGYHYLSGNAVWTGLHKVFLGVAFAAICFLFAMSFKQDIALNGDNAEYMISAQSLVERGGVYRLYTPSETPNTLASIGLPVMLAPIYAIWGFDIYKMKMLILLFGISLFPLSFRLFKNYHNNSFSALLAITVASSPYLIANATAVMTEAPYLCWSLLALISSFQYLSSKRFHWFYYASTLILIVMSYLTRAVGVAILVALLTTLFLRIPWGKLGSGVFAGENRLPVLKLLAVSVPLVLGFLVLQLSMSNDGISQLDVFFGKDLFSYFNANMTASMHVAGHMLFSNEAYRWYQMLPDVGLSPTDLGYLVAELLILAGLVRGLLSLDLNAYYSLTALLLILLASLTPQEMVIMRYLSVLMPFIIYYFVHGVDWASRSIFQRFHAKSSWHSLFPVMALATIFMVGMSGNITNLSKAKVGTGPHADAYIYAASWCGKNLPSDSYVMSFKPRITYLYSGLKGRYIASTRDQYSEEFAREKLEEIEREGVTHLIIDGLSGTTQDVIFPIIQNNAHLFEAYDIPELERKCTVIRYKGADGSVIE